MLRYTFLHDSVIICTRFRIKQVSYEVAERVFEVSKLYAAKRINKKLLIKCVSDLLEL